MTTTAPLSKAILRKELLSKREALSPERRKLAELKAINFLKKTTEGFPNVLSFASKASEINLWPLNEILAAQNKLFLPKTEEQNLVIYKVNNLTTDLLLHPTFQVLEPDPRKCQKVPVSTIACILVPGLAFDEKNHRLGYGKGFYDTFLKGASGLKIGIGFTFQGIPLLPVEEHDHPLDKIFLF